jgi:hypothetical protein
MAIEGIFGATGDGAGSARVTSPDANELLEHILIQLTKIEIHMSTITDDSLSDSDAS